MKLKYIFRLSKVRRFIRDKKAMWPRAKRYGLRYYFDKEFRRVMKQRERNKRDRAKRGSGFMSSRQSIKRELFYRYGNACRMCGQTFELAKLEIDHIKRVADGGTNDYYNLQLLCHECHLDKDVRKKAPPSVRPPKVWSV